MTRIFINYRTRDEAYAAVLLDEKLSARLGRDAVFLDSRSIPLGVDFRSVLWPALARCRVLLAVIGPRWTETGKGCDNLPTADDFVHQEIALALKIGLRVIPVLVGDARMPAAGELPDDIRGLVSQQYVRINRRTTASDVDRLVAKVAEILTHEPDLGSTHDHRSSGGFRSAMLSVALVGVDGSVRSSSQSESALALALQTTAHDRIQLRARPHDGQTTAVAAHAPPITLATEVFNRLRQAGSADPSGCLDDYPVLALAIPSTLDGDLDQDAIVVKLAGSPVAHAVSRTARAACLIVSDAFYRRVVACAPLHIDATTFQRVNAGTHRQSELLAWVHVAGRPTPPGVPAEALRDPSRPAAQPTNPPSFAGTATTSGANNGVTFQAPTKVNGDVVNGPKTVWHRPRRKHRS